VYTRPATTFVASFMGSPPMNLLKAAPNGQKGQILGIRPEHLLITPLATPQSWLLRVEAVEMLGAERLIYARLQHAEADELVIIRTEEGHGVPPLGANIYATPQANRLHHFDASTGHRVESAS
jgi:sn-glycerol 3-phosphate transport system ATP-binding protein